MAKKKFNPLKQPTESKSFVCPETGYNVRVVRGMDSVEQVFYVPHYMTGKDFRKWRDNTKDVVDEWREFKDEEFLNRTED